MKHTFIKTLLYSLVYILFFHLIQFFLYKIDMVSVVPDAQNLSSFDVGWYKKIIQYGYEYRSNEGATAAFFPLFPYLWKFLSLNLVTVSILNALMFAVGFSLLAIVLAPTVQEMTLWITFPMLYIMFVPYSEALFFLLLSASYYSIRRGKIYLTWILLFLLSLSRPVAMILIPAFLISELITNDKKTWLSVVASTTYRYVLPLAAGLAFFIWIQYYQTGVWFAFFKQEEAWGRKFQYPTFPLNSLHGPKYLWMNALALFAGLFSIIMLVRAGILWLFKNKPSSDSMYLLSLLYMAAIFVQILFFSPTWDTGTTNVFDTCRYVFATPFFIVFINKLFSKTYSYKDYIGVLLLSNAFWLLFAHYNHIQYFLYFNVCTAFVMLYMLYSNKKLTWVPMIITAVHFFLQVHFYQYYLTGYFPG